MPYVTGKRYRIWWGVGLDWVTMRADLSALWDANDKGIHFTIPYTEDRAGGFPVTTSGLDGKNSVV